MIALVLVAALAAKVQQPSQQAGVPAVFAPGVISGPVDADAATFMPDGRTVYFDRLEAGGSKIMVSRLKAGGWSAPETASFSGVWADKDPAMSPDGSFMIFDSNRPATPGGKALDLVRADGTVRPGQGNQLWRVDRKGSGWGEPTRLPDAVNDGTRLFSPSVVRDGSVYFQRPDPASRTFHIVRAQYRAGRYEAATPVALGPSSADERDPAVAPDESFMVFSANYGPKGQANRLYISFRRDGRWEEPIDLGDKVNHDGAEGPHLGAGATSVYFDSTAPVAAGETSEVSRIWRLDLTPWLAAHKRPQR
ncbi:hypothetical protein [Caulobacter sp. 1776]|uniref:TolB family protein n=1 Tax=Caulobacter sp. 1776 TaxID=3156420 RepID=UPI003395E3CC